MSGAEDIRVDDDTISEPDVRVAAEAATVAHLGRHRIGRP